jgi:hypothetical protein
MKDLNSRFEVVQNIVAKLSSEFGVEKPKLIVKSMSKLHGFYAVDVITLNLDTLHNNLSVAIKTVRHEFCHYLEDILDLPENKSEIKARRFEKNILALGILPKNQRKLCVEDAEKHE